MLDDLVRLGTNCARMARFTIGSLKFRADILYTVYREMRRTYRALIATGAQSMGIYDAAITREERQMSRHGADDQCGAVIAYWATYYLSRNWQCSFCGASGVVDTRGRALNESGQDQGVLQFFLRCTNRDCYHALLPQGYSVFLQALIQGVALVVNTIAELLASLGASIAGASVRALQLRIARADVVHKYVDDDH